MLIAKQKEKCLFEATDLFQCTESDSGFLRHISTVKETQIYGYDPETKAQSSVWKSPLSPQQDKSVAHSSISPPPYQEGSVHHEFASSGQRASQRASKEYYLQFMLCLCDSVCHKQTEK